MVSMAWWLGVVAVLHGAPSKAPPRPSPPPVAWPSLPVVARVGLRVGPNYVVVEEDVQLAAGDGLSRDLDFFVAYGGPGMPRAVEVRLFPADGAELGGVAPGAPSEALATTSAPRCPPTAHGLLGRPSMGGVVVRLPADGFRRAASRGAVVLRVRTLLDLPPVDARGGREVLARLGGLGAPGAMPMSLHRIEVIFDEGAPASPHVEARLCGPDASPQPLAVQVTLPTGPVPRATDARAIAPVLSTRRVTDDLCIRLF